MCNHVYLLFLCTFFQIASSTQHLTVIFCCLTKILT
nr:MAG TPA: hypothetical protein [Caudoviricetes sp.]